MPRLELPGVTLYYEREGEGPPLLVVSGTGSDLRTWSNPLRWGLPRSFDVVAHDHRGLGQSVATDRDRRPTMADFAEDAIGLVDALGWDRFAMFGISFGGMVAQEVALALGDRISRLVLACTSSGGTGGSSYPLHDHADLDPQARAEATVAVMDTRSADDPERRATMVGLIAQNMTPVTPGARLQLEARRRHDTFDRLGSITALTLVAAGRFDGIAPLANSEALVAQIPHAELQVFEGGHAFFAEDRTALPAITAFLLG